MIASPVTSCAAHHAPDRVAEIRTLLERALYDLHQGWQEAAIDALGRALRLLTPENTRHD